MDILSELRLRRWARENYVPAAERASFWDPIVLDEMRTRDEELAAASAEFVPNAVEAFDDPGSKIVPLAPITYSFDPPHLGPAAPHLLSKPSREPIADAPDWGFYFG